MTEAKESVKKSSGAAKKATVKKTVKASSAKVKNAVKSANIEKKVVKTVEKEEDRFQCDYQ